LRKWAFLYSAAAIAVIGCGGSGNPPGHSTGSGTKTAATGVAIKLTALATTPPGAIEVAYLTGQGRAPGDLTAVVQRIVFDDNYGEVTNPLAPDTFCPLVGFQNNVVHLDVSFTTQAAGVPSRLFTSFLLDFLQFDEEGGTPGQYTVLGEPASFPKTYPATIRVFPGRTTSLPVFIDDSMFTVDATNPLQIDYNESQFLLANGATSSNPMTGFVSDFVGFNLRGFTNPAQVPQLIATATGTPADAAVEVFFSGDVYGVADATTSGANFELLTLNPSMPIGGTLGGAGTLQGPAGTLPHAGTYSLLQLNPTDLTETLKIVAGQGIWRQSNTVLVQPNGAALGAGNFTVTFPSSADNNMQEIVSFVQDANSNISALYFGFIDMDALTFNMYPVVDIMSGSTAGGLTGTISQLFTKQGSATTSPDLVHSGNYTFNTSDGSSTAAAAAGLKTSSTFYTFRL